MNERKILNARDRDWHPPSYAPGYKSTCARAPKQPLIQIGQSMGDLTGPTFGHQDIAPTDADLIINYAQPGQSANGQRVRLHGRILDENARPVPHTLVEIWQANAGGRYRHKNDSYLAPLDPNFGGCGRTISDAQGRYEFRTILPAPYPWPNGPNTWRPAHVHFSVFGHAFAQRLITQCYFEGDPLIPLCPIVQTIPSSQAVDRLIARLDLESATPFDMLAYRFDIILRGTSATLFENRKEGN
jgi:protocatechuate 3,4-dioxygenase beta subunit